MIRLVISKPAMFFLLFFVASVTKAQLVLEGSIGLARNSFFHFDLENQNTTLDPQFGMISSIGVKRLIMKDIYARFGILIHQFRIGYRTENIDGRESFGRDLEIEAFFLGGRVGLQHVLSKESDLKISILFNLTFGQQVANEVSGSTFEFIPKAILGPDGETFTVFVKDETNYDSEAYEQIRSFYFGSDIGIMLEYPISQRVQLQFHTLYSLSLTPFFEDAPPNLLRNSINAELGVGLRL
jgi:hypothetical protein